MPDFKYYNYLGFYNPYYIVNKDGSLLFDYSFSNLLNKLDQKTLDYTGLVEIACSGYTYGDRTIVKEIKKNPWMARPNEDKKGWDYYNLPKHAEKDIPEKEIHEHFYSLVKKELQSYIQNHDNIGIFLSGGMDSRIAAIILKDILSEPENKHKRVFAFTWGGENSRDVVYAKIIAKRYNWNWEHLEIDAEQLKVNYQLCIEMGCEFSPIHLHAISKILTKENIDCMIGGSFGDSMGRGEYSGRRVNEITPMNDKINNRLGLLRSDYLKIIKQDLAEDLVKYHKLFPEDKFYQQNEIDQQAFYFRGMLNPCMNLTNRNVPLYQLFTDPEVYGFIWSLNPELRNDNIYKSIIQNHGEDLLDIPWSRTGFPFGAKDGKPDSFKSRHTDYASLIRDSLLERIETSLLNNENALSKIFDFKTTLDLLHNIRKYPILGIEGFEKILIWISCVLEFIKANDIEIEMDKYKSNSLQRLNAEMRYKIRYIYHKFR